MVVRVLYTEWLPPYSGIFDPTRDVMIAASVINKSKIGVWKLQWKQVSTSSSNSGFHVFKEFLYHAQVMNETGQGKEDEKDCSKEPRKKIVRTFHGF